MIGKIVLKIVVHPEHPISCPHLNVWCEVPLQHESQVTPQHWLSLTQVPFCATAPPTRAQTITIAEANLILQLVEQIEATMPE